MAPSARQRSLENHRNHYLFSDYYLDHRLNEQPEWAATSETTLRRLADLLAGFAGAGANESQTEADWIRPVLEALGHHYNVQVSLKTPFGTKTPDYILYPAAAGRQAALTANRVFDAAALSEALAVADAKAWDRPLDQSSRHKGGDNLSDNPSLQIYVYIQHSGLDWGLLTNGRLWRLYHRDSAERLDVYYEVDLPALIEQGDPVAFNYFYAFFRREAFGDDAFLSRVLAQSRAYARGISDTLKEQVYEALRHLAQGFLDFPGNGLTPTPQTFKAIYDNSLIVLYRLLFILYAESRALLPEQANASYHESYSLNALKRRIAIDIDGGRAAAPSMDLHWHYLRQLWRVIDSGNPHLAVPAYNGGLFKAERHPFLEQYRVGDSHLRPAIDLLSRTLDPRTQRRVFVDYRDLEIRHLGSIYEGLLEYQLRRAEAPLRIHRVKGRETYEPATSSDDSQPDISPGQVYLITDKGERKATGSYYTPDYIVRYIVAQALGPILESIRARYTTEAGPIAAEAALISEVLAVNVLDPSMGSGHFLVEATDFIARFLVTLGLEVAGDLAAESELAYWRRRVVQACIYGVDVNPLAVELAKLSLWLTTVAKGKPLSFLDHHLRAGNSLIGSRMADLPLEMKPKVSRQRHLRKEAAAREAGQLSMLEDSAFAGTMMTATGLMDRIESLQSETLAEVRQAEEIYYQTMQATIAKAQRLADLWTARHFGLDLDETLWGQLVRYLLHGGFELPQFTRLLAQAHDLAQTHRFFHWELAFPEVFFDQYGRLQAASAGFDAVVGNPPYVRQEVLSLLKTYLAETFADVYAGTADLYIYFYKQGVDLLSGEGRLAYISSGTFARANFAKPFRETLPQIAQIETVIDFGENQPFEGAEMVRPSIVRLRKGSQTEPFRSLFIAGKIPQSLDLALAEEGIECSPKSLEQLEWTFQSAAETQLLEKILKYGIPLGDAVNGKIYRGILTGLNEAFYVDQKTRDQLVQANPTSTDILKETPYGADLRPWYQEDEGRWLIALPSGWTSEKFGEGLDEATAWQKFGELYPAIANYLSPFAEAGRKRHDKGQYWWELRACAYYDEFETPKILWPDIAKLPRFSWDRNNKFVNNTGYMIPDPHPSLLAILQSRVLWFAVSRICQPLRLRAGLWQYRMIAQFMNRLPIPNIPDVDKDKLADLALTITHHAQTRYDLHRQTRRRLLADLGSPGGQLNQKLTAWWDLDFRQFRQEVQKAFKRDIPLAERDEWETWLSGRQAQHRAETAAIVRGETALNERVYGLFKLTAGEIRIVEASTKYGYGEV